MDNALPVTCLRRTGSDTEVSVRSRCWQPVCHPAQQGCHWTSPRWESAETFTHTMCSETVDSPSWSNNITKYIFFMNSWYSVVTSDSLQHVCVSLGEDEFHQRMERFQAPVFQASPSVVPSSPAPAPVPTLSLASNRNFRAAWHPAPSRRPSYARSVALSHFYTMINWLPWLW